MNPALELITFWIYLFYQCIFILHTWHPHQGPKFEGAVNISLVTAFSTNQRHERRTYCGCFPQLGGFRWSLNDQQMNTVKRTQIGFLITDLH